MSDLYEADFGTAFYRTRDTIKNFKIKVHLERVTSTNVIPQAILEKEAGSGAALEMDDLQEKSLGGQRDTEEFTFKWQQKVLSKRELDLYSQPEAYDTGFRQQYHNDAKIAHEKGKTAKRLFSYVDHDSFTKQDSSKKTTSPDEEQTVVAENMSHVRQRRGGAKKHDSHYIPQINVVEKNPTEDLKKVNRMYSMPVQTMYIMADLSADSKSASETDEFVLCTIKYDSNGVLMVRPDFNKGRKPYKVEAAGIGRDLYEYTVEHCSPQLTRQEQERESKMLRELYSRHADFLQSCVGHEFEPPSDMLRVMVFGEIDSAKNFENDHLFISYFVDLPHGWYAPSMQHLSGTTHTCKTKIVNREDVAYFSYPFEFQLFYKEDSNEKENTMRWPILYVEVSSLDSWQRFRTEGYSYTTLPTIAGRSIEELHCWRPIGRTVVSELRRFFVGGNAELEDPTYTAVPSTFEGKRLSKYGFRTISTGSVQIQFSTIQQSQSFLQSQTSKKKMGSIIDRLGKSAAHVNIMNVLEAFQRAKKRMVFARDNLKKEYIETLKALEVEDS